MDCRWPWSGSRPGPLALARNPLAALWLVVLLLCPLGMLAFPAEAVAADLQVHAVSLSPCPAEDVAAQPTSGRPVGASCWALRGEVENPGSRTVVDTDVFARILDASGEPVLQNRSRIGSIGDVPPGSSSFALRLAVPSGTPGPLQVSHVKAKGFSAPVRSRAGADDELLPLEESLS